MCTTTSVEVEIIKILKDIDKYLRYTVNNGDKRTVKRYNELCKSTLTMTRLY